ncbi:transposase [Sulfobacillus thermosulfidooxidans]|uniref:transposase n=1 Tax=Sulfobacillus thermosulfidooxidans TaxID=28034 RepID=UPI0006B5CA41|nr:transposase [Sulfobacillus thermosulfidooxidans]
MTRSITQGVYPTIRIPARGVGTLHMGAGPHERTETRTNRRNGYRSRTWDTRVGTIRFAIPKLLQGTDYSEFLESRRRSGENPRRDHSRDLRASGHAQGISWCNYWA